MEKMAEVLLGRHIPFQRIGITQPTLEDVFLRLTQDGKEDLI